MHIVYISTEFVSEPAYGGLAQYLNRTVCYLGSRGHHVHVLTPSEKYGKLTFAAGVTVHRLPQSRLSRLANRFTGNRIPITIKWLDYALRAYIRVRMIAKTHKIDVIQASSTQGCGIFALLFRLAPTIVRVSSFRPLCNLHQEVIRTLDVRLLEKLEIFQLKLAEKVICPSRLLCRVLRSQLGTGEYRHIPSPIYLEVEETEYDWSVVHRLLQERDYLLFFGRLQLHKGVQVLAEALGRVLESRPSISAVFVGENGSTSLAKDMRGYIGSQLTAHAEQLVFIGHLDHRRLYPVIKGAKLVILPSLIENFPNACLEAMTLGRPVLGTNGASFEEIIDDGIDGFLCRPGDADDLAENVKRALRHPNLEEIGKRAQEKAANFGPEKTVGKLLDFYEAMITQRTKVHKR